MYHSPTHHTPTSGQRLPVSHPYQRSHPVYQRNHCQYTASSAAGANSSSLGPSASSSPLSFQYPDPICHHKSQHGHRLGGVPSASVVRVGAPSPTGTLSDGRQGCALSRCSSAQGLAFGDSRGSSPMIPLPHSPLGSRQYPTRCASSTTPPLRSPVSCGYQQQMPRLSPSNVGKPSGGWAGTRLVSRPSSGSPVLMGRTAMSSPTSAFSLPPSPPCAITIAQQRLLASAKTTKVRRNLRVVSTKSGSVVQLRQEEAASAFCLRDSCASTPLVSPARSEIGCEDGYSVRRSNVGISLFRCPQTEEGQQADNSRHPSSLSSEYRIVEEDLTVDKLMHIADVDKTQAICTWDDYTVPLRPSKRNARRPVFNLDILSDDEELIADGSAAGEITSVTDCDEPAIKYNDAGRWGVSARDEGKEDYDDEGRRYIDLDVTFNEDDDNEIVGMTADGEFLLRPRPNPFQAPSLLPADNYMGPPPCLSSPTALALKAVAPLNTSTTQCNASLPRPVPRAATAMLAALPPSPKPFEERHCEVDQPHGPGRLESHDDKLWQMGEGDVVRQSTTTPTESEDHQQPAGSSLSRPTPSAKGGSSSTRRRCLRVVSSGLGGQRGHNVTATSRSSGTFATPSTRPFARPLNSMSPTTSASSSPTNNEEAHQPASEQLIAASPDGGCSNLSATRRFLPPPAPDEAIIETRTDPVVLADMQCEIDAQAAQETSPAPVVLHVVEGASVWQRRRGMMLRSSDHRSSLSPSLNLPTISHTPSEDGRSPAQVAFGESYTRPTRGLARKRDGGFCWNRLDDGDVTVSRCGLAIGRAHSAPPGAFPVELDMVDFALGHSVGLIPEARQGSVDMVDVALQRRLRDFQAEVKRHRKLQRRLQDREGYPDPSRLVKQMLLIESKWKAQAQRQLQECPLLNVDRNCRWPAL